MFSHVPRLAAACALALSACSQSDPPNPNKVPPAARIEAPRAPASPAAPSAAAEIDAGLKDRLARQEAAARMFEKNVLQPQPPRAAAPAPAPAEPPRPAPEPSPAPNRPAPTKAEASPPAAPKISAPPRIEPPVPARADVPAAKASPPARTDIAAARPTAAAVAAPAAATRLVTRVDPDFPREALQAGVDAGSVRARMTLDESGAVTRVEVVEANPRRVFDRAVVRALTQWRYNEGAAGRTVEAEVDFKR
jgi:protein TonB